MSSFETAHPYAIAPELHCGYPAETITTAGSDTPSEIPMPYPAADLFERLTGYRTEPDFLPSPNALPAIGSIENIGYSQLNELMLAHGYRRISESFFQFLLDQTTEYKPGIAFHDAAALSQSVDRFRFHAALRWGSVRMAFEDLSRAGAKRIDEELEEIREQDAAMFGHRCKPVLPIESIPASDTYYLGYMIEGEIKERLAKNPHDKTALSDEAKRAGIVEKGTRNHYAYLTSDHMDVYVATSMRQRHEFVFIRRVCDSVFCSPFLAEMELRYFDPTQAYTTSRIDKGLSEALMLKRAKCTLYLLQESDSIGKDSELASTLAQGKPVIAFVPQVPEAGEQEYVNQLLSELRKGSPSKQDSALILEQLMALKPQLAWVDKEVMGWCANPDTGDLTVMRTRLGKELRAAYEKRANTLKNDHPLGIQVDLADGVANGVLVARTEAQCAELIRRVILNSLQLELEEPTEGKLKGFLLLRERITGSVFRVVTPDRVLTNSFWTFYR